MKRIWLSIIALSLQLVACGPGIAATRATGTEVAKTTQSLEQVWSTKATPATAYRGLTLPTQNREGELGKYTPPPAWLVVGDQVVPATLGTFTTAMHADVPEENLQEGMASIDIMPNQRAMIVIGFGSINELRLGQQPESRTIAYYYSAAELMLQPERQHDGNATVLTLDTLDGAGVQVLHLYVTFPVLSEPETIGVVTKGEAHYFWRLKIGT